MKGYRARQGNEKCQVYGQGGSSEVEFGELMGWGGRRDCIAEGASKVVSRTLHISVKTRGLTGLVGEASKNICWTNAVVSRWPLV